MSRVASQGRRSEPAHVARRRTDPPRHGATAVARRNQRSRSRGAGRHRAVGEDESRISSSPPSTSCRSAARRRTQIVAVLDRHKKFLRGEIAHQVNLKYRARHPLQGRRDLRQCREDRRFANSPRVAQDLGMASRTPKDPTPRVGRRSRPRPTRARVERAPLHPRRSQWLGRARQAGRADLDPGGVQAEAPFQRQEGRPCRHARPAGLRRAAGRLRRGDQDRALRAGRRKGLSLHRALGRRDRHRRRRGPGGRRPATRARIGARSPLCCRASPARFMQRPPAFSAIKINGERAYDLARDGEIGRSRAAPGDVHALASGERERATRRCWRPNAARAPMCAPSPAISAARSAATAMSSPCGARGSVRFSRTDSLALEELMEAPD